MKFDYNALLNNPEQLAYKIADKFKNKDINPFEIAKSLNMNIYLMSLSHNIFSFYTKAENSKPSAIINGSIPIQRIRYNMALQIYFHLTGSNNIAYYKEHEKNEFLSNAKTFASCFLLPENKLEKAIKPYLNQNGKINYDDILFIANEFGVSFKTTAFRIFYKFNNIEGIENVEQLRKVIGERITYREERQSKVADYQITDLKYIQQMFDYISFLPTEQIQDIMKIKLVRDVIYGDIKTAEQMNLSIEDINKIIARYQKNGHVTLPVGRHSQKTLLLQELVEGQLDAYNFIFSDFSKEFAKPENAKYILKHLHTLLFDKVTYGSADYDVGNMITELNPTRTVGFLFDVPHGHHIEKAKQTIYKMLEELLTNMNAMPTSKYIDESIKIFFETYTAQLFHDGNSRVSKTLLNYLLHLKGIPSSFSVADSIREQYLDAIAKVGYDQRIQKSQERDDFNVRVVSSDGKIGEYHINGYGYEWVVYSGVERDYDPSLDTIEYYVKPLYVPERLQSALKEKLTEGWEPYREIDYRPLQAVIYKGIISSYIDCMKVPEIRNDPNVSPNKKPN